MIRNSTKNLVVYKPRVVRLGKREIEVYRDVPVFSTKTEFMGKRVTRDMLRKIVQRMSSFGPSAVIIGHTDDDGKTESPIVGYATNYRISESDDDESYLVCDIIMLERGVMDRFPRRSVELWSDYTIDPLCLLGSSTPRVDLPTIIVKYSRYNRNRKWSSDTKRVAAMDYRGYRARFDRGEAMGDDIVERVLSAIKSTPEWNFLSELLQEWHEFQDKASVDSGDEAGAEASHDVDDILEGSVEAKEGEAHGEGADEDELSKLLDELVEDEETKSDERGEVKEEEDSDERDKEKDDEEHKYQRSDGMSGDTRNITKNRVAGTLEKNVSRVQNVKQAYSRLVERYGKLYSDYNSLVQKYRRLERRDALKTLIQEGYDFDLEAELQDCEKMSDGDFQKHLKRIRERYRRKSPVPFDAQLLESGASGLNINKDIRDRAIEYAWNHGISFDEALKKVLAK